MNVEPIRTFIAIELPDTVKTHVEALEAQLKKTRADVNWVSPRNMHITLKFLGDTPLDRLDAVREGVGEAAASMAAFSMGLNRIGAFPDLDRPRVFWIDVQEGRDGLVALQRRVEKALLSRRFVREERPFSPHLTIGRVRSPQGLGLLTQQVRQTAFQTPCFSVTRIVIIKSELRPNGPVYTVLDHIALI